MYLEYTKYSVCFFTKAYGPGDIAEIYSKFWLLFLKLTGHVKCLSYTPKLWRLLQTPTEQVMYPKYNQHLYLLILTLTRRARWCSYLNFKTYGRSYLHWPRIFLSKTYFLQHNLFFPLPVHFTLNVFFIIGCMLQHVVHRLLPAKTDHGLHVVHIHHCFLVFVLFHLGGIDKV